MAEYKVYILLRLITIVIFSICFGKETSHLSKYVWHFVDETTKINTTSYPFRPSEKISRKNNITRILLLSIRREGRFGNAMLTVNTKSMYGLHTRDYT